MLRNKSYGRLGGPAMDYHSYPQRFFSSFRSVLLIHDSSCFLILERKVFPTEYFGCLRRTLLYFLSSVCNNYSSPDSREITHHLPNRILLSFSLKSGIVTELICNQKVLNLTVLNLTVFTF